MLPLVAWGVRRLGSRKPGESFRPQWAALAMAAFADREAAQGVVETYEYHVGGFVFHFTVDDGSIQLHQGAARDPIATLTTDEATWADLASGNITGSTSTATGALELAGDPEALERVRSIFSRRRVLAQAEASRRRNAATMSGSVELVKSRSLRSGEPT